VLCVPLLMMVVLKLNRKARLVPGRYMGWVAVAVKAGVLWEVLHLIWCATPEEHARACREAAREVWGLLRGGQQISMGSVPGETGAAWYALRPLLPSAVFDPSHVGEVVEVRGRQVVFRQRAYDVEWLQAPTREGEAAVARATARLGGEVRLAGGVGVFLNPLY
jgi:hypothetical protein